MDFLLPTNFHEAEFQCPCCHKNLVQAAVIIAIQSLRHYLGFGLDVTSGYRCPKHNASVGRTKSSKHPLGLALHIAFGTDFQLYQIVRNAQNFGFNGIGIYYDRGFVHLDFRPAPTFWYDS